LRRKPYLHGVFGLTKDPKPSLRKDPKPGLRKDPKPAKLRA